MKLFPRKKILFFILAACIVFSIVFAENLIDHDHEHEHAGIREDCFVCLHIESAQSLLKALKMAAMLLYMAHFLVFQIFYYDTFFYHKIFSPSLVTLKVRINS